MRKIFYFCVLALAMLGVAGCTSNGSGQDELFLGSVQPEDVNTQIKIDFWDDVNDLRIGGNGIAFDVINSTNHNILVFPDTDLLIFEKDGNEWRQVEQRLDSLGVANLVPTKQNDPLGVGSFPFVVIPGVANRGNPIDLRIVVIGTMLDDEGTPTPQKVGAYADITLQP